MQRPEKVLEELKDGMTDFKHIAINIAARVLAGVLWLYRKVRPLPPAIYFCYNQCIHHIHHSLYVAIELSNIQEVYPVKVLSTSREATAIIREELESIRNRVIFEEVRHPGYDRIDFDVNWFVVLCRCRMDRPKAVVVTDYYDNVFRQLLVKTFWVFIDHGIVNRDYIDPHRKEYDLAILPSQGVLEDTVSRIGPLKRYGITGYPKLDYFRYHPEQRKEIFADQRPVILYNPHFDERVTSFFDGGEDLLKALSATGEFNILFMPHPDLARKHPQAVEQAAGIEGAVLVDRPRINLDYLAAADIYITDVSSAVFEWLIFDRPAVFFNSKRVNWKDSPYYQSWTLGPVAEDVEGVLSAVRDALGDPGAFRQARTERADRTFANRDKNVSLMTARLIAQTLGVETT